MKKFKLFKMLAVLIVLITSINTAWAYTCDMASVYYDNSVTQWTYVQLLYEHSGGSAGWNMQHISNTKLYYCAPGYWNSNNFSGLRFADGTNADWGWAANQSSWDRTGKDSRKKCTDFFGGDIANNHHLFTCNTNGYGSNIGHPYYGTDPTILNKNVTVGVKTKVGNNDYSSSVASVATISMQHYTFNSKTENAVDDYYSDNVPTLAKGSTVTYMIYPAYTSDVRYSYSDLEPGYEFIGWYDEDGNLLSANDVYTPNTTDDYEVYAYFAQAYAFVEGRFRVYNNERDDETTTYSSGSWNNDSRNIPMTFDAIYGRYELHTYMTLEEMTASHGEGCSDCKPYFYIKTSSSSSDLTDVTAYRPASGTTLVNATRTNGVDVASSGAENSVWFNNTSPTGYVVLYFDQHKIWYELEYQLSYDGNGKTAGSLPTYSYAASGGSITAASKPGALAKTGYDFSGWNAENDGSGTNYTAGSGSITMGSTDKTVYANWTQTVTLHDNNGQAHNGSTTATWNAAGPFSITAPTKTGYHVEGYYAEVGCTNKVLTDAGAIAASSVIDGSSATFISSSKWAHAAATTLYTKWTADEITVTLDKGEHGTADQEMKINYDAMVYTTFVGVSATGYDVEGYYDETQNPAVKVLDGTGAFVGDVSGFVSGGKWIKASNCTLTAHFTAKEYSGTIDATTGTSDGSYTVNYMEKTLSATDPVKAGYHVSGYYLDEDCTKPLADGGGNFYVSVSIGDDKYTNGAGEWIWNGQPDLYVTWAENTIVITLHRNDGTDASTTTSVVLNTSGYTPSVSSIERTGYEFNGYYTETSGGVQVFKKNGATNDEADDYIGEYSHWIWPEDVDLYAQWTPNEYTVTLHSRYGSGAPSSVTATYDSGTLSGTPVSTKWGNVFGGWEDEDGALVIGTDGKLIASVTGYTDGSKNWTHDGNVDLYAKWTPKSNLYWISGDGEGYSSGTSFISAGDNKYYVKVDLNKDDKFHLGDGESVGGPSSNTDFTLDTYEQSVGANSTYFNYNGTQKQTFVFVLDIYTLRLSFENFVIYRSSSDKDDDPHTAYGSVAGYSGTIYGDFELRIPVDGINKWSTLCLPFKPTKVQAWGGSVYHDLYPCHRKDDGLLYQGYYVIRTPERTTDLSIEDFKQWNDPGDYREGGNYWTPAAETPYIIQWQNKWFMDRYISYWGNDETIRASFVAGSAPTADGVVNVLGNATMGSGSVKGAYVLTEEYGDGAWLRDEDPEKPSAVGPFECYIRANGTTTENNLVIKRRTGDDTTTGWDEILNYETKEVITVYTISGLRVAQYKDCSFEEAGRRMNAELSEGIYILNAGNESVKLIIR